MIFRIKFSLPLLILFFPPVLTPILVTAQKLKKNDRLLLTNLETHIRYLSDDRLEGRRTGSAGEKAASDYICSELSRIGLQPKGDNKGWLQAFDIDQGREVSADALFTVNDHALLLSKEYFPLAFSPAGSVSGSAAIALQERGVPWFLDLRDLLEEGAGDPHFDLPGAIRNKAAVCAKKGATALLLYNSSKTADNLIFDSADKSEPVSIPVIYITREAKRKYLKDESASVDIRIKVDFAEKKRTGHNVVGFLDNGAGSTALIGAHYDHDNASGVAALIELARSLAASRLKHNNYLFVAFSGQEQGEYGSRYFAEHSPVDVRKLNYMINLDLIGRLSDSSHTLWIGGYGSSPAWWGICREVKDKKGLVVTTDSTGGQTRDQVAFYRRGIPILSFSTGGNAEYHLPADDAGKINYAGELLIVRFVYGVVEGADSRGRLTFSKKGS
jgi:peptidase M28-like protein